MTKNFLNKKIDWVWVMKKLNTPFSVSSYPAGAKIGAELFGYPEPLGATWYDRGDIYFDKEEIEYIKKFLGYKISNDEKYPEKMAKKILGYQK